MAAGGDQRRGLLVSGPFVELEDALCERVAELRDGRPLDRLTIVVGSVPVRTCVGDLLVRRLGAVANVHVVSFERLAADLVTTARGAPPSLLGGLARERLLRRLVSARAGRGLAYFGPVSERPHFAAALGATFADLREALLEPRAGWADEAGAATGGDVGAARAKAADLELLFGAYGDELRARDLVDDAALFDAAARELRDGAAAAIGTVILYGIYDLNGAQEELAAGLVATGADLFVPVPAGHDGRGATVLHVAARAGLAGGRRPMAGGTRDLSRLGALWGARATARPAPLGFGGDGTLRVLSVADERAECREALRVVLTAATRGAALHDCAVVVPHADDIERFAAALAESGLPVACRRPDDATGPRLLRRLADCIAPQTGSPFGRRAVVDLLASAPLACVEVPDTAPALWLDEARRAGIVGGIDQWTERLARARGGLESRAARLEARLRADGADAEAVAAGDAPPDVDDEASEPLRGAPARLEATRTLEIAVGALTRACGGLPSRATWGVWAESLAAVAGALFEAPAAQAAGDAAGRLQGLAVLGEEVDVGDMAGALREILTRARVPVGRIGRDGVAVLTPLQMRGLRFHTVAFTGLAEGGFPARGRPDPILGDGERRRLEDAFGVRLPLAERREAEELVLFAFACEAARDHLTLIVPRTDAATGRPRLPSRLLLRLASLAAGHPVGLAEFQRGEPLAPVWHSAAEPGGPDAVWIDQRERDAAVLADVSLRDGEAACRYLGVVLGDPAAAERRLEQWRASRSPVPGPWDGLLGGHARAALVGRRHPFAAELHPTRLERFVACPFAFLLRDVLGLDAPEEPGDSLEMDAREFGTLAHAILQRTYAAVIAGDLDLAGAESALGAAWEACCAEAEADGVTGAALAWRVRRDLLREDLLESMGRDPVFGCEGGRPSAIEWGFGEAVGRPVSLALPDGGRVRFAGRLDRVDVTPAGARVIDYKTGGGVSERKRLRAGLGVQLPVYQLAVRTTGMAGDGEVASLYRFVTRRGGFGDLPLPGDEAAAAERLGRLVAGAVRLVDAGSFPRLPQGRCEDCDLRYACGSTSWAVRRKGRHPRLAEVVDLQRGVLSENDDAGA